MQDHQCSAGGIYTKPLFDGDGLRIVLVLGPRYVISVEAAS